MALVRYQEDSWAATGDGMVRQVEKGKGKSKSSGTKTTPESSKGKNDGNSTTPKQTSCTHFLSGCCKKGNTCPFFHVRLPDRCWSCGDKSHTVNNCPRPKKPHADSKGKYPKGSGKGG